MARPTLSSTVSQGFREALAQAPPGTSVLGFALAELPPLLRSGELSFADEDRIYSEVIARYQAGQRQLWGAVLLELMAPALIAFFGRFSPRPPVIEDEDLTQQLILSTLLAAEALQLKEGQRFMERRLLNRVACRLVRWFRKERASSPAQTPFAEILIDDFAYQEWQKREVAGDLIQELEGPEDDCDGR